MRGYEFSSENVKERADGTSHAILRWHISFNRARFVEGKGLSMDISVSEEVQTQLDQVKEWMESKIGREVTYNDVILQILKNFQSVLYPEDLGSA
jgi:hypothetical protein